MAQSSQNFLTGLVGINGAGSHGILQHIAEAAAVDAGPVDAELQVVLGPGVEEPVQLRVRGGHQEAFVASARRRGRAATPYCWFGEEFRDSLMQFGQSVVRAIDETDEVSLQCRDCTVAAVGCVGQVTAVLKRAGGLEAPLAGEHHAGRIVVGDRLVADRKPVEVGMGAGDIDIDEFEEIARTVIFAADAGDVEWRGIA